MKLSRTPRNLTIGIGLWGALGPADHAWAYKVTTHQVVAVRGAERLPEGDLKSLLLGNEQYLRAGTMGPDLFLLSTNGYPSDLAHYCKTDELAKSFLALSKGRSDRAQAFAYGWFSHNVVDSVAHPWVNGLASRVARGPGRSHGGPALRVRRAAVPLTAAWAARAGQAESRRPAAPSCVRGRSGTRRRATVSGGPRRACRP